MLKWLNGSSDSSSTQGGDSLSVPTPPPSAVGVSTPVPAPANRVNVSFVPVTSATQTTPIAEAPIATEPVVTQMPPEPTALQAPEVVSTAELVQPQQPLQESMPAIEPAQPSVPAAEITFGASPAPAPETTPAPPIGVIEMQDGLLSDLMTEALEENTVPAPAAEPAPVEVAQPESQIQQPTPQSEQQKYSVEETKQVISPVERVDAQPAQSEAAVIAPETSDLVFPDIAGDLRRLMQDRWISVAKTELDQISRRREEVAAELGRIAESERQLAEQRRALETERTILVSQSDQWERKLKSAENVLQKVVEEVAAL